MFNLYYAGARNHSDGYVIQTGGHKLLSYVNDKSTLKKWIQYKRDGLADNNKLFIDSGAYSAHTRGIELDVDAYIAYLNEHAGLFECIAQIDKIPGTYKQPKTPQELMEAPILSWENYNYMRERLIDKDRLLPIFHQGEDFKHLQTILDARYNGSPILYMGISPANDLSLKQKEIWLEKVFRIIYSSNNSSINTHAFGLTSRRVLQKYPFTSADSTTWIQEAKYGVIRVGDESIIVSDRQVGKPDYWTNATEVVQNEFLKRVAKRDWTLEELESNITPRANWNIIEWQEWVARYKCSYKPTRQKTLF